MRWNLNGVQCIAVVAVAAVLTLNGSTASASVLVAAGTLTTAIQQPIPPTNSRLVDSTKAATGDKRCDQPTAVADHHPSNELAISREMLRAEKTASADVEEETAQRADGRVIDDDGVSVDIDDDLDGDDDMQNDQPFAYRAASSGQQYYGNIRRHPQQPPPSQQYQQQRSDDHNTEYTREITIKQGRLRGIVRQRGAQSGLRPVHQYLGIPYAAAPVGSGRFMPPGAPPPWQGSKEFTRLSLVCPQQLPQINGTQATQMASGRYDQLKRLLPFLRHESEDCLFLNLYAPLVGEFDKLTKFPVIVFVHGESYEWNSGNPYDGSVLASYGQVVVVTLNYRLGILGFLKPGTGDHTVSNFGLLDHIAALQWVKDNIEEFGGNNSSVTLMGHGTGAACVNLLMLSPVARGLFHRAILMSGSALSDWAIARDPLPTTMQVVQGINCPLRDDNEEILQCLRKKRYQEIVQQRVSTPEFGTVFGPVVDNLVVPNQPHKIMGQYNEMFSQYDLLFGMTEIESYHNLNAIGLLHGLLASERDSYLRSYMQSRYEIRPDIAMALTLQEYTDLYNNPKRPLASEHRDTVLEILSDARIAAPLLQTGLFHSKVNPRSYMYLFGHNSRAGEYANLLQSIVGEDLPYVFGAPLAAITPFPNKYSAEERLLSESIMVAWTNFAKTGNPRAPTRDRYLNLEPQDWERYDIDWPAFNAVNMSYLNIGIPPVVNPKYRHKYMQFWNQALPDELNRALSMKPLLHQREPPSGTSVHPVAAGDQNGGPAHIVYYPDKTTEDPLRTLKLLLNRHKINDHSDMYNTQSTAVTATIIDNGTPFASVDSFNDEHRQQANMQLPDDNKIIAKADATVSILITVIVCFLLLNALGIGAYAVRRYYTSKTLQSKLDVMTLDGGTTEADMGAAKRHKFSGNACGGGDCGDESFMLHAAGMRMNKKPHCNDYETVVTGNGIGGHSPINGYLLGNELSTSTVDPHTKVSDWMCQEILNGDSQLQQQPIQPKKTNSTPSFSLKGRGFFRRCIKVNDAPTTTTSDAILKACDGQPIVYQKPRSYDTIICQDVDVDSSLIDGSMGLRECSQRRSSIPSLRGSVADGPALKIDHRHSRSDPVQMYYRRAPAPDEDITFFIEDPAMSSTRDASIEREPMSAEDALKTIRMRNYPKVLPRVPDDSTEYVSSALIKRRSLPPQYFGILPAHRMPPAPPPRTTSTLGRSAAKRDSNLITTSPLQIAAEPPLPVVVPEISCNVLHVGPLLPKSTESIYSTVTRTPRSPLRSVTPQFTFENSVTIETTPAEPQTPQPAAVHRSTSGMRPPIAHRSSTESLAKSGPPKVAMRPSLLRQTSMDSHHRMSVQSIPEESTPIDVQSTTPQPTTGKVISSRIPQAKPRMSVDRSGSESSSASKSSSSSAELTSSSGADTVKQVF